MDLAARNELINLLAELYGEQAAWRRIATAAGLNTTLITFTGGALNDWSGIVVAADREERLGDLIDVVLAEQKGPTVRAKLEALRSAEPQDEDRSLTKTRTTEPVVSIARLPVTTTQLFGRDEELAWLDRCWAEGVGVASIVAWGGVGKTALVNAWLVRRRDKRWDGADRVFGWSFYSQGTDRLTSSDEFIEVALRWFGDPKPTVGAAWDKGERLAGLVRRERTLLILDGLEPLQWGLGVQEGRLKDQALEALLKELAAQNKGLCLITSRIQVANLSGLVGDRVTVCSLEHLVPEDGAELLKAGGVKGTHEELLEASREYKGHCLALALLASYLCDVAKGDVRRHKEIGPLEHDERLGGHARRVLAAYQRWFAKEALAVLHMLGLFDRPASVDEIAALRADPVVPGLTDGIVGLAPPEWNRAVAKLRRAGLLAPDENSQLDAHPLVRQHFGEQLRHEQPAAWREGHRRLYEHLRTKAEPLAESSEEMAPLCAAVVHGCLAGKHREALEEVFQKRIQRNNDVAVLSAFFNPPWERLAPGLSYDNEAWILNSAGIALLVLGRLPEAKSLLQLGEERRVAHGHLKHAAVGAANITEVIEFSGELREARAAAQRSVVYAARAADVSQCYINKMKRAAVLCALGLRDQAESLFKDAERNRCGSYSAIAGFRHRELLLDENQASNVVSDAEETLPLIKKMHDILAVSLEYLSLGRAHLILAKQAEPGLFAHVICKVLGRQSTQSARAKKHMELAVTHIGRALTGLRSSGWQPYLPFGLLARAALHLHTGARDLAHHDLDEAIELSTRCGFRLHEADARLGLARLALAERDRAAARTHLDAAQALIKETGYHRRDGEVAELAARLGLP